MDGAALKTSDSDAFVPLIGPQRKSGLTFAEIRF
jgi:hypothetical protein